MINHGTAMRSDLNHRYLPETKLRRRKFAGSCREESIGIMQGFGTSDTCYDWSKQAALQKVRHAATSCYIVTFQDRTAV